MSKKVLFDNDVLKQLRKGVDAVADTLKVTLGPSGRNVTLEKMVGSPQVTKDGVSVARELEFNGMERMGAESLKQASIRTAEEAGDGTTSSVVLAQALFHRLEKLIASGSHPVFLKRGLDKALKEALNFLYSYAAPVNDVDDIIKVGTLASNGDQALGEMIAEAMEMVGKDGIITVEESSSIDTYLEFSEGVQLDRGYLSHDFITDKESGEISFEEPYVLLANENIDSLQEIMPVLEYVVQQKKPLLIIAHDVAGEALQTLIMNHLQGKIKCCAVKAPRIGDKRSEILDNLGVLLGGQVMSQVTGVRGTNTEPEALLGTCKSVTIDKGSTTIIEGGGEDESLELKIKELRGKLAASGSEHDKEFYQQQVSQLSGGIAIIRVGASTETELKEYKARVEDALSATQCAVQTGIVPGGGCTLIEAADFLSSELEDMDFANGDEEAGYKVMIDALEEPFLQIVRNTGRKPEATYYEFRRHQEDMDTPDLVFDAREGEFASALECGVIDPARVVEQVLTNAVSTVGTLATASCMVVDQKTFDISEEDSDN